MSEEKKQRLEEVFLAVWKGRENADCVWWDGVWWSWNRLNDLAKDCEQKLKDAGFARGQRIAILLPNSPMVFALSVAAWRLGGAVAPLNARTGIPNLLDTIHLLDVNAVIMLEELYEKVEETGQAIPIPIVPAKTDSPLPQWKGRIGKPETEDIAIIFSTSGTSGNPKAVTCLHTNIMGNVDVIAEHVPGLLDADSIFLNVLPNFHTFGYNTAGLLPMLSGIRQAVLPSFVPVNNTIDAIRAAKVNVIVAVPTVMTFLIGALVKTDERIEGMKFVITGGDKLNISLDERSKKHLGCGIVEGYGLTECSPVVAVNRSEEARKLGTVGQPFCNYEIEIHDRDGNLIDLHEEGVLWVKGPSVVPGYFRDEKTTAERFKDGWFNTGDVVQVDEDGYIKIVDRATDIIIVSGFNVYPQEVEAVLCEHPAVQAAVAVGEKNSIAGELVKAFIIKKEGMDVSAKELMQHCREKLAHFKVPRKIGFVDEYPISPAGKILRRELRKQKIQ
ncbi:AMP-binding protein [Synergistaceae bacterium OttesenSCG-928-D05]|nr:AMP-binding protein [Synergistaceae bacterium OttesenSCG-928-D05]